MAIKVHVSTLMACQTRTMADNLIAWACSRPLNRFEYDLQPLKNALARNPSKFLQDVHLQAVDGKALSRNQIPAFAKFDSLPPEIPRSVHDGTFHADDDPEMYVSMFVNKVFQSRNVSLLRAMVNGDLIFTTPELRKHFQTSLRLELKDAFDAPLHKADYPWFAYLLCIPDTKAEIEDMVETLDSDLPQECDEVKFLWALLWHSQHRSIVLHWLKFDADEGLLWRIRHVHDLGWNPDGCGENSLLRHCVFGYVSSDPRHSTLDAQLDIICYLLHTCRVQVDEAFLKWMEDIQPSSKLRMQEIKNELNK